LKGARRARYEWTRKASNEGDVDPESRRRSYRTARVNPEMREVKRGPPKVYEAKD